MKGSSGVGNGRRSRASLVLVLSLIAACSGVRLYYVDSELRKREDNPRLVIVPGPWRSENVPVVTADTAEAPDDLIIPMLRELTRLPGAMDACDPLTGRQRPDATEYCIAVYRTSKDWRASWPVRALTGETNSCPPPYGGVDDSDFGEDVLIFGFAHNHPCGTNTSSPDLNTFPWLKTADGIWVVVSFAASPGGKLARDSHGQLIPAWAWLATGRGDNARFYKWNRNGSVFRWNESGKTWEQQAVCTPQFFGFSDMQPLPPKCTPELR